MAGMKQAFKRFLLNDVQTPLLPPWHLDASKRRLLQVSLSNQPGATRVSRARIGRDRALDRKGSWDQGSRPQERQPSSNLAASERGEQETPTPGQIPLQLTQRGLMPLPRLWLPVVGVLPLEEEVDRVIDRDRRGKKHIRVADSRRRLPSRNVLVPLVSPPRRLIGNGRQWTRSWRQERRDGRWIRKDHSGCTC